MGGHGDHNLGEEAVDTVFIVAVRSDLAPNKDLGALDQTVAGQPFTVDWLRASTWSLSWQNTCGRYLEG